VILFIFDNIPNTHIHVISYENIIQEGIDLKDIIYNKDLHNNIINFDFIIRHNYLFDINILLLFYGKSKKYT